MKYRHFLRSALIALAAAASLSLPACQSTPKRMDLVVISPEALAPVLAMGKIGVSPPHLMNGLSASLEELVLASARRNGIDVRPAAQAPEGAPSLDLLIHQKSFMRGFEETASITLVLTVRSGGLPAAQLVYTSESPTGLASFSTLYGILDEIFPPLARKLGGSGS